MPIIYEERPAESPLVAGIWRSRSEAISQFTSVANSRCDLVFTKERGKTSITLLGPEAKASSSPVPDKAEFFGILFRVGTFMPHLPVSSLVDNHVELPTASSRKFWLNGAAWEIPTFDNADTFIERLVREGLLVNEPVVETVMLGQQPDLSLRTVQRRFVQAAGLPHRTIQQIERARYATMLLRQGTPVHDVAHDLGYFDQPHLINSLKHFVGHTPTELRDQGAELSLFSNTPTLYSAMIDAYHNE